MGSLENHIKATGIIIAKITLLSLDNKPKKKNADVANSAVM
ncbi:MAG TPA: hypothetical protein PK239_11140 [Chitinophagales bacterium]|nr:hypothetical protein [Chitinophagales bacterium]HRK27822.1 hypothetical protein [Chitinophagales bacterium]